MSTSKIIKIAKGSNEICLNEPGLNKHVCLTNTVYLVELSLNRRLLPGAGIML